MWKIRAVAGVCIFDPPSPLTTERLEKMWYANDGV